MLVAAITLGILASVIGGWSFMCDAMPEGNRPRLAYSPLPLLLAAALGLIAVVLLFFIKWYASLLGLLALVLSFNFCAAIWHSVYRVFRL
jgi:hypothetical protein